jgi:hypothetical protein
VEIICLTDVEVSTLCCHLSFHVDLQIVTSSLPKKGEVDFVLGRLGKASRQFGVALLLVLMADGFGCWLDDTGAVCGFVLREIAWLGSK